MAWGPDFDGFWNYYSATSRTDYSNRRKIFHKCFTDTMYELKLLDFRYPGTTWPTPKGMKENLTKICSKTRVKMLSAGVPKNETEHILEKFKKWYKESY